MNTKRLTLVTIFRAARIRSRSLFLTSLAVLSMATTGAPQAYAADAKNYPGSMCVGHNTPVPVVDVVDGQGRVAWPFSYDNGAIRNVSGASVFVVCPVVRDHTDRGIASGWVRVINAPGKPIIVCKLVRNNRSGGQMAASVVGPSTVIPIGGSDHQLNYSSLPNPGATWHYYYYCPIPHESSVVSYQVNENT